MYEPVIIRMPEAELVVGLVMVFMLLGFDPCAMICNVVDPSAVAVAYRLP